MLPTHISLSNFTGCNKQLEPFWKQFEPLKTVNSVFHVAAALTAAALRRLLVTLIFLSSKVQCDFCTFVFQQCFISFLITYKWEQRNENCRTTKGDDMCEKRSVAQKVWRRQTKGGKLLSDSLIVQMFVFIQWLIWKSLRIKNAF